MAFCEKYLKVKKSGLPGSGKGLFTKKFISAGTRITEYKGKITTWAAANHDDGRNSYIFYVSRSHVIDGEIANKKFAHYSNDARGYRRVAGLKNNAEYSVEKKRVFMDAIKDIAAGEEIFVGYGKEYWDVQKKNGLFKK